MLSFKCSQSRHSFNRELDSDIEFLESSDKTLTPKLPVDRVFIDLNPREKPVYVHFIPSEIIGYMARVTNFRATSGRTTRGECCSPCPTEMMIIGLRVSRWTTGTKETVSSRKTRLIPAANPTISDTPSFVDLRIDYMPLISDCVSR